jgi:predicted Zn finger-like uncharacterized protein
MKVSCPSCQTNYNIDDKRIPPGGAKLKCARCQNTFPIKPAEAVSALEPEPVSTSAPAPQEDPFGSPGENPAASEAVPLPGATAPSTGQDGTSSDFDYNNYYDNPPAPAASGAIPLPGAGDPYASSAYPSENEAVPLPGGTPDTTSGFDYGEDPYAPGPQADAFAPPPAPSAFGTADYGAHPAPEEPSSYVPEPQADAFDLPPAPAADPYGSSNPFDMAPRATTEVDTFGLPPPEEEEPAEAALVPEAEDPFGLPPAPAADPYAAAPEAEDPFALPPPPAGMASLDFSEPPPDVAPSSPDALEFDPTAPVAQAGDDLDAGLSAPLPPPSSPGTADGLEMLSFVDNTASGNAGHKPQANGPQFHVRRRSGKVFGPFEEGVIVKMLEDGQLLGNEDVSSDAANWMPIGTVSAFAEAIQKLMEGPGTSAAAPAMPSAESNSKVGTPSGASLEQVQKVYGGRMASVSVVDSTSRVEVLLAQLKKRLPQVIAAAVALLVVGVGLGFGTTRYGVFGMKKFFPSKVKPGSPEAADVEAARKGLLQDTFQGYKQARALAAKVLASSEYPEVRALWCQSVFYLQRRYSAAESSELARCRSQEEAESLELLGENNVEYVKFLAGKALAARDANTAIQQARNAWSREANQGDVELALLLAEALSTSKQNDQAIDTLKRVLGKQPDSVKAHHALGNLYQAAGKADEAAQSYEAALKADATHIISAVELAAVELLLRKDAKKGLEAAERALEEKAHAQLGPAEQARARTLKGIALFQQGKHKEAEQELRTALQKDSNSLLIKANLARVLRAQHQLNEALPLFKAVSESEPSNLEYTDGYISTLVITGKMEEARKAVEAANGRFPGNARLAYLHGRIDEARDSNSTAEEHYKRAIKADAELFEAYLSLGRLYLRLHRDADARAQLELAAAKAPENAGVHTGLGELALAEGNTAQAQEAFARAVQLDPSFADAHLGLSRLALLVGDLETAQKEADTALELDPHVKDGRSQRGTVLWRLGKLDEAITELEQAKKEDPRSMALPITLGAVYLDKGNHKEAESNLLLVLKNEPSNPEANFHLAQVRARRGEYPQALESMKSAVDRAPRRADYRYAYGVLLRDAKQLEDAIVQWKQAVALNPKLADAHEALGQAYLEGNQLESAIASFQTALKADPKRFRALASIGDVHSMAMRWREAIRSYEQALKADPKLTNVFYKVGRAWSEQNQHAKSITWYQKAVAAEPTNAMAWYHLGFSYKEKGKKKDAVKAFREYLARKPEAEDRREIEDEISFLE